MARGSSAATTAATTSQNNANQLNSNAGAVYGALAPQLMSEAAAPPGLAPTDKAAMRTGNMQTAAGGAGAARGQGILSAARTRNAGGSDAAIAEATRESNQALTEANRDTDLTDVSLKENQRGRAEAGLQGLYGTNVSGGNTAQGIVPGAVNANTEASNASWNWSRYLLAPILNAAGNAASGGIKH